ncbi:DUF1643 domain-containing protein [Clostridium sp.]|uniref:DUF1643 domain-containing protein n=1 Tax=Clostridium sp. TaxID=1506 RepID=UPI002FCA2E9E
MDKYVPYDNNFFKTVLDIKEDNSIEPLKRYSLEIELNRTNNLKNYEKIVIIMMNPSKANKELSDDTVNRIIKEIHIQKKKVKYITILNLFSVFEKDSKKLKDYMKEYGYEVVAGISNNDLYNNDDLIRQSCENVNEVIIAWGDGKQKWYRQRENDVLSILAKINIEVLCCNDLSILGYPRHPSRLPQNIKFISYSTALEDWVMRTLEKRAEYYHVSK